MMKRASTSCRKDSRLRSRRMRPLLESVANSRRVMSEMANPSHFWRGEFGQAPARRQHAYRQESPEFPPVFRRNRRGNDITCNSALASEKIVDVVCAFLDRDKLHYWFAMFCDHHGLALSLNFIHDRKTMDLKRTCSHFLHWEPP